MHRLTRALATISGVVYLPFYDELMRDGRAIEDLDTLVEADVKLDDKLYERQMERLHKRQPKGKAASR